MTMTKTKIYTAGKMDWESDYVGCEDSTWRQSVEHHASDFEWLHPTETFMDHGGGIVEGCVSEDMSMIDESDGVVAYFSHEVQVGTLVEVMHSIRENKPTLVLFSQEYGNTTDATEYWECDSVSMRGNADNYWFLINYLKGDANRNNSAGTEVWEGLNEVSVLVTDGESTPLLIERWADRVFDTGNPDTTTSSKAAGQNDIGELRTSYSAALSDGKVDRSNQLLIGAMAKPREWFENQVDVNYQELAPPYELLQELEELKADFEHNSAWKQMNYDQRFSDHLRNNRQSQEALHELVDKLRSGENVLIVGLYSSDKKSPRKVIQSEIRRIFQYDLEMN